MYPSIHENLHAPQQAGIATEDYWEAAALPGAKSLELAFSGGIGYVRACVSLTRATGATSGHDR